MIWERIAAGQLHGEHIDALAHQVSAFHARIATADPLSCFGTLERISQPVQENFRHLFDAIDDPIRQAHARELEVWCQCTFAARRSDFIARKRDGFVRECHGDMHLGNMILPDGEVVIFDCIEFNADLRWIDFTILAFHAHPETLQRRVAHRSAQADDASEADLAVLHRTLVHPLELA